MDLRMPPKIHLRSGPNKTSCLSHQTAETEKLYFLLLPISDLIKLTSQLLCIWFMLCCHSEVVAN